jgi:hypothetical protein
MAKEQDLPLNPLKISGLCGRLMCCLRYEFDAYKDFKGRAPKRGAIIETAVGLAKVSDFNTPRETVTMRFEGGDRVTVPLAGMTCGKEGGSCPCCVDREVLAEAGNAAAIAMATEEEAAEFEPVLKPSEPQKRERSEKRERGDRRERKAPGEPAATQSEQGKGADAEPSAEKGGTPRRRRRRGGSGTGQSSTGETAQQAPREPAAPSSGGESGGEATSGDQPSAGRKRRRRRRSGGGSGTPPA